MNKKAVYILGLMAVALAFAAVYAIESAKNARNVAEPAFSVSEDALPNASAGAYIYGGVPVSEKTFEFPDGGVFSIFRFDFSDWEHDMLFTYSVPFSAGSGAINIKWQDYDATPRGWVSGGWDSLPKATLFIETGQDNIILSVPGLYYNSFEHNTIESVNDAELPVLIERTEEGYQAIMRFAPVGGSIGEFWFYKTGERLIEWNEEQEALWIRQDLHRNRRFSFDGYYYRTYESYQPYSENGFFRNSANFTGAQIMASSNGSAANMGYAMTKICMQNQNEAGYWETGAMSLWLKEDYGIGYGFYDTRFSTDFASSLLNGYSLYADEEFLSSAVRYGDFLIGYADTYGYRLEGEGILVPDYWSGDMEKRPHTSLNHQLAEINFLLELYIATGAAKYKEWADKLLAGIENTAEEWLLPDKNLKYALMYDSSSNNMVDYPYLTYNDLFALRELLASLGEGSAQIDMLMESKREWMDENKVTEYRK